MKKSIFFVTVFLILSGLFFLKKLDKPKTILQNIVNSKQDVTTTQDSQNVTTDIKQLDDSESTKQNDLLKTRELAAKYAADIPKLNAVMNSLQLLPVEELRSRANTIDEEIKANKLIERANSNNLSQTERKRFNELFIDVLAARMLILEKMSEENKTKRVMAEEYEKNMLKNVYNNS